MLQRPLETEYPSYFANYISQVPDGNLLDLLQSQMTTFLSEIKGLSEDQLAFSYAENKWTLRQVLLHINDVERIFAYRALACLRSDTGNIPGFEQDEYAEVTKSSTRTIENIMDEFEALRKSNIQLFSSTKDDEWLHAATINNNKTTARSMAYMLVGHIEHHRKINKEKYLG